MFAGLDDAAVRQDDFGLEQVVTGQAVLAPENPKPSAERETGDPNGRTAASGDGEAVLLQCVIDISEPRTGTDGR